MKVRIEKLILAAIVALMMIAASSAAMAQGCPASPNYSPDFSANQSCVTLNNNGDTGYPGFYPSVAGSTTVLRLTPNSTFTAGSAWYNTQQAVSGAFSTTFTFQLSGGNTPDSPADGIAFLIQNSSTSALGPDGCGIGFGDSSSGCTPASGGIPNSLAVEFNTYFNSGIDPNANDVTIQNCSGTGPNSVDPSCSIAVNSNLPDTMADGNVHTVTINYSGPSTKLLDVILDNVDLFPGGLVFDLTTLGLNSGNAWVGFTASTGGGDDNQDILSWTFTPGGQAAVVTTTSQANLNYPNSSGNNVYSYTGQLTQPYSTPVLQVTPILMTQQACDKLVQANFWPAHCFVYANAENTGMDAAVMFSVTCPNSPGGSCGSNTEQDFFAELGTVFEFQQSENPWFVYPGIFGLLNPFPGWLKGAGPNPAQPCVPPASGPLFQSNQIDSFFIDNATTKGHSGGTGSCWVATYDTPGELWPGIKITSPQPTIYKLNQQVTASYACNNPVTSKPTSSPVGPYLTAASCSQSSGNQTQCQQTASGLSCTGTVDTTTTGLHSFAVTAIDSGANQNIQELFYLVK
ncbi:MAG TPA: L-type lectin-domain containing protein [Terriglobales bacterium]